jgi:hypothetical protein
MSLESEVKQLTEAVEANTAMLARMLETSAPTRSVTTAGTPNTSQEVVAVGSPAVETPEAGLARAIVSATEAVEQHDIAPVAIKRVIAKFGAETLKEVPSDRISDCATAIQQLTLAETPPTSFKF